MKTKLIAVDFDGTCVMHEYPQVGQSAPHAARVLKRLVEAGHELILWTMRGGAYGGPFVTYNSTADKMVPSIGDKKDDIHPLYDAVNWFRENGIHLHHVNCNPHQDCWSTSRKVYGHVYIDDAACGVPLIYDIHHKPVVDWLRVEAWLIENDFLEPSTSQQLINDSSIKKSNTTHNEQY